MSWDLFKPTTADRGSMGNCVPTEFAASVQAFRREKEARMVKGTAAAAVPGSQSSQKKVKAEGDAKTPGQGSTVPLDVAAVAERGGRAKANNGAPEAPGEEELGWGGESEESAGAADHPTDAGGRTGAGPMREPPAMTGASQRSRPAGDAQGPAQPSGNGGTTAPPALAGAAPGPAVPTTTAGEEYWFTWNQIPERLKCPSGTSGVCNSKTCVTCHARKCADQFQMDPRSARQLTRCVNQILRTHDLRQNPANRGDTDLMETEHKVLLNTVMRHIAQNATHMLKDLSRMGYAYYDMQEYWDRRTEDKHGNFWAEVKTVTGPTGAPEQRWRAGEDLGNDFYAWWLERNFGNAKLWDTLKHFNVVKQGDYLEAVMGAVWFGEKPENAAFLWQYWDWQYTLRWTREDLKRMYPQCARANFEAEQTRDWHPLAPTAQDPANGGNAAPSQRTGAADPCTLR